MAGSVVAQGQRGTRRACANVAAAEQQIESIPEAVDFLVDLIERDDSGRRGQEVDRERRHRKTKRRLRDKIIA
jgi:hypothetical protein